MDLFKALIRDKEYRCNQEKNPTREISTIFTKQTTVLVFKSPEGQPPVLKEVYVGALRRFKDSIVCIDEGNLVLYFSEEALNKGLYTKINDIADNQGITKEMIHLIETNTYLVQIITAGPKYHQVTRMDTNDQFGLSGLFK